MDQHPDLPELPRGIALAWGVAAEPQRGPKREMSVERIVDAAVELADAEGLGAVSMAAVAARLGYTPMSLYRYVSAKDDLTLLMQESAMGGPPSSLADAVGWRARLTAFYDALLEAYRRHPWVLQLPITSLMATPNSAAWLDAALAALDETPLDDDARLSVALLMSGSARWHGEIIAEMQSRVRASGGTAVEAGHADDELLTRLVTADGYPHLRRAIDAGALASDTDSFRYGLDRVLDGVAAEIARLEAGGAPTSASAAPATDADALADKKYREAKKAVREAEKELRAALTQQRHVLREARERIARRQAE